MSLEDELFEARAARVNEIEALGYRPFGKRFDFSHTVPDILRDFTGKAAGELTPEGQPPAVRVRIAGRPSRYCRSGVLGGWRSHRHVGI